MYLQTYLEDDGSSESIAITTPESPELVPNLKLEQIVPVPALGAESVSFLQTYKSIPIFSGRITVDIDVADKSLVAINGQLAPLPDVSPIEKISSRDALSSLISFTKTDESILDSSVMEARPELVWFLGEEDGSWHLSYHFKSLPISPPGLGISAGPDKKPGESKHFCIGHGPRSLSPLYDFMVDAHSGEVVFFFSASPCIDIPVPMRGQDFSGVTRNFYGISGGGNYLLSDPIRNIRTFDLLSQNLDAVPAPKIPAVPIAHSSIDLGASKQAAVAAHFNTTLVFDFFNDVLKRNSVDGKGMMLVSVVNVYSSDGNNEPHPTWRNAMWWQKVMWYGEVGGKSLAAHLDVIAHELTHGITESTSRLIYRDLPGALNESFSDIFGVIIHNWYPASPEPVVTWNWQIGAGLDVGGGPLRDFANPALAGQPDHFSQYHKLPIQKDNGGVHIYSGIHNRAIYLLLTQTDSNGLPAFPVSEAALLLYLTLTRLAPTSNFSDSRRTFENIVQTYYQADPATAAIRLKAVADSFNAVGIA